jgi:hypothetical protein
VPRSRSPHIKKDVILKRTKTQYQKRDKQILIVASYLAFRGEEGATIYNIIKNKEIGLI